MTSSVLTSPTSPSKILNLLSARETRGVVPPSARGARGPAQVEYRANRYVRMEDLASAIAWNPRRMQNMILAVGPGTPASEVLRTTDLPSASSSPASSDDEMMASDIDDSEGEDSDNDDGDSVDIGGDSDADSDDIARGQRRRRWTRKVLQTVHAAQDEADAEAARSSQAAEEQAPDTGAKEGSGDVVVSAKDSLMEELLDEKEKEELAAVATEEKVPAASTEAAKEDDQSHHSRGELSSSTSSSSNRKRQWSPRPSLATSIERPIAPSMRHGGCINTSAWLTCPWRLSYANHDNNTLHGGLIVSSSHSANSAGAFSFDDEDDDDGDYNDAPTARKSTMIALDTTECTTQLITSGDDRFVKFWDVSNAMGGISPYPGGPSTSCPFAHPSRLYTTPSEVVNTWKKRNKRGDPIPGSVIPLATLATGHRGNVFHATPLYYQPGKVATCGADGYMRLCDVESGSNASSSTIVVSPDLDEDGIDMPIGYLRMRGVMCFSHHFLDANTGLLCSEQGLKRFDLRLSPREQPSGSVLGGQYSSAKACAIWSASDEGDCFDSAYVFVGSSSGDVALCDLRMTSNTSSRIVQHYRPSCFGPYEPVSVSGLDVSRDLKELLVSYESDQIYSFPIFPYCKSAAGPSVEELASYSAAIAAPSCTDEYEDEDKLGGASRLLPDFASYGGHLNRFTFLKRATFAGPNDEYICTGSDSGHAWIYEKATGAVVSLLKADHSTCNGIVPHPTLPFFATYGIDSTAKLWRATHPVGDDTNDSDLGRCRTAHKTTYEASQPVHSWKGTQSKLDLFCDPDIEEDHDFTLLPDEVPSHDDEDDSIFGGLAGVLFRNVSRFGGSQSIPFIANDLASLPKVLLQNYFTCLRAFVSGDEEPIKSPLDALKRRVGLMRLKYQADRLGLLWDPEMPWVMKPKSHVSELERKGLSTHDADIPDSERPCTEVTYGSNADLVPDHPGDWIAFDSEMSPDPLHFGMEFNEKEYQDFYFERYAKCQRQHNESSTKPKQTKPRTPGPDLDTSDDFVLETVKATEERYGIISASEKGGGTTDSDESDRPNNRTRLAYNKYLVNPSPPGTGNEISQYNDSKAWDLLFDTVMVLKEGGNAALSVGAISLAAQRYDKAIRYCSIAFLRFPEAHLSFLSSHKDVLQENGGHEVRWSPLLKALITIRLNLSMTMLRSEAYFPNLACDHAHLALLELKPFATSKGSVLTGRKLDKPREGEPDITYIQAKELQSKAYFRLGNAQIVTGDYSAAVKSFDLSIKATRALKGPDAKPEAVVQRRLAEAKKLNAKKRKRQRDKFAFAFEQAGEENDELKEVDNEN